MEKSNDMKIGEIDALNFCNDVQNFIKNSPDIQELLGIWSNVWSEKEKQNRVQILFKHWMDQIKLLTEDVLQKERDIKNDYIERLETLLEEIDKLQTHLNVKISYDDVEEMPLHEMALSLNKKAEKFRLIRDQRLTKLTELRDRELLVTEQLGVSGCDIVISQIPSENDLKELEEFVLKLENEKKQRLVKFLEYRTRIIELFQNLGIEPLLIMEKNIVDDKKAKELKMTQETLTSVKELLDKLEGRLVAAKDRRKELVEKLQELYGYLEISEEEQGKFFTEHQGCQEETINSIKNELDRCLKLKSENIGKFIERIRVELRKEWDMCFVSEEYKNNFFPLRVSLYNEDLYTLHELELKKWQNFRSENEQIFQLYKRHNDLFDKLKGLDGQGRSVKRFQNRGGQLLQEEKTRKLVAKELPKVEEELFSALAHYEITNNEPFLYFGRPLSEVLDDQWKSNFDTRTIDKFRLPAATIGQKRAGCATPGVTPAKVPRNNLKTPGKAPDSIKTTTVITRQMTQPVLLRPQDETIPSYDEFQENLTRQLDNQKGDSLSKKVSRSTEILTPKQSSNRHLRVRNNNLRTPLSAAKSTPVLNTVNWLNNGHHVAAGAKTAPPAMSRRGLRFPATNTKATRKHLPLIL